MDMELERPDLSKASPEVQQYIAYLELKIEQLEGSRPRSGAAEPSEPPTTLNVITISRNGLAKRTPRHLYARQRRGGMGVFDLQTADSDYPAVLTVADQDANILLITDRGRAFRLPVNVIQEGDVRDGGASLAQQIQFHPNEHVMAALPEEGGDYVILVSERGWVQRVRRSFFGKSLFPGMSFHDPKHGGPVTAACWANGGQEIFMATQQGQGIRFRESQAPERGGCLGLRVDPEDKVVAVTAVTERSHVFLIGDDGKGTIRQMSGFRMNKAPGAGGKLVMKTDKLVAAAAVQDADDILAISQSGKIIRFQAAEVPPKEGVVQGVNCMNLRNDAVTAATITN